MNTLRINVLCNNRMAIPAIQQLAQSGLLASVGVPATNPEMMEHCAHATAGSGVRVTVLERAGLARQLDEWIRSSGAGLVFIMTFPWKIPSAALEGFPDHFYNFHYGLLPSMRGADPIFESIRQGRGETGITVHKVTPEIDKGPVVLQQQIALDEHMTHGLLCSRLSFLGMQICRQLIPIFAAGNQFALLPQQEKEASYYPRPGIKDVAINWQEMDSAAIHALARACNPWNKGAYTSVKGWSIRICSFSYNNEPVPGDHVPGTIIKADPHTGVWVACRDGKSLCIDTVYTDEGIFDGKKLMQFGIAAGDRLINVI